MKEKTLLKKIMSKASTRRLFLSQAGPEFVRYYFPQFFSHDLPEYAISYLDDLRAWENIFFKWFRWSAKTTLAKSYIVRCILNKNKRNIMWYSFNSQDAESNITDISNFLIWYNDDDRIIKDYWQLYVDQENKKSKIKKKKTMKRFVTENEISVRAVSLWVSPRWAQYIASDWVHRPDLIIFDDLDTLKSVSSIQQIDKHERFIRDEVFWWASNAQFVFLWNTINQDWLVPRFQEYAEKNPKDWKLYDIAIYDKKWSIVRDRFVETDQEAEKKNKWIQNPKKKYTSLETLRRKWWPTSFAQNMLNIPYVDWSCIIKRQWIQYYTAIPKDYRLRTVIWIDPAFSEKTHSDPIGVTITSNVPLDWWLRWYYVREMTKLEWDDKSEDSFVKVIKGLYDKYDVSLVYVESNNWWEILARMLKKAGLAVICKWSTKDKVTRLREKEGDFAWWRVRFDKGQCGDGIEQLLSFPNVANDDMVDSLVFSMQSWWDAVQQTKSAYDIMQKYKTENNWPFGHQSVLWDKF